MASITPGVPGGRIYTLPDADGTIALTSSLSGYLPLTGGSLSTTNTSETLRINNNGTGYALYVQSNSYFQGDVRFQSASNSILKTVSGLLTAAVAGTDYVIPSALSAYLPLAGGTLTGALNGTSATFTGTALLGGATATNPLSIRTANGESYLRFLNADGTSYGDLERSITGSGAVRITTPFFRVTGTLETQAIIASAGFTGTSGAFSGGLTVTSASSTGMVVNSTNGASFRGFTIQANGTTQGGIEILPNTGEIRIGGYSTTGDYFPVIYSDGVAALTFGIGASPSATFSSSVDARGNIAMQYDGTAANQAILSHNGTSAILYSSGNTTKKDFTIYRDGGVDVGLIIKGSNGNVLIGTTTDAGYKLDVNGTGRFSDTIRGSKDGAGNLNTGTTGSYLILSRIAGGAEILGFRNTGSSNGIAGIGYTAQIISDGNDAFEIYTTGLKPVIFGTNATEQMRITSGGNVLVNRQTLSAASLNPNGTLQVNNEIISTGSSGGLFWENRSGGVTNITNWYGWYTTGGTIFLYNGGGNIASINSTTGAYTPLSDINKKKDFEESTIGLNEILGLKPTLYRMINDESEGQKELGFIAQEVKDFIPYAYVESGEEEEKFIGLNFNPIVAALVKAVQELKQK